MRHWMEPFDSPGGTRNRDHSTVGNLAVFIQNKKHRVGEPDFHRETKGQARERSSAQHSVLMSFGHDKSTQRCPRAASTSLSLVNESTELLRARKGKRPSLRGSLGRASDAPVRILLHRAANRLVYGPGGLLGSSLRGLSLASDTPHPIESPMALPEIAASTSTLPEIHLSRAPAPVGLTPYRTAGKAVRTERWFAPRPTESLTPQRDGHPGCGSCHSNRHRCALKG